MANRLKLQYCKRGHERTPENSYKGRCVLCRKFRVVKPLTDEQRLTRNARHRRWASSRRKEGKIKETKREWFQVDVRQSRQNAKKYGALNTLTYDEWKEVVEQSKFTCYLCRRFLSTESNQENTVNLEHCMPLSRGGSNTKENVAPACWRCNIAKQNLTLEEFRELAKKWIGGRE